MRPHQVVAHLGALSGQVWFACWGPHSREELWLLGEGGAARLSALLPQCAGRVESDPAQHDVQPGSSAGAHSQDFAQTLHCALMTDCMHKLRAADCAQKNLGGWRDKVGCTAPHQCAPSVSASVCTTGRALLMISSKYLGDLKDYDGSRSARHCQVIILLPILLANEIQKLLQSCSITCICPQSSLKL